MNTDIRVRYAPSPTGQPHIGNIRTALFNWLFAKRHHGRFIVRIEDTDQARLVPDAVRGILSGLRWLNIDWDEGPEIGGSYGPYFQSERLELYEKYVAKLIDNGLAYHCYCSSVRLQEMREEQLRSKKNPGYDRRCLYLSQDEIRSFKGEGQTPVTRFKMPDPQKITVNDIIRGEVSWRSDLLDDFVILKSDGFPTYHLANVVDDYHMKISHVLRAEEWLSSTPRHMLLYRALDLTPPIFGHLPMILGPDRSKLSKRHGATSIHEYREMGYIPEALTNFMALLGWSLDDKTEIMRREELVESFSLDRIIKSGAVFNLDKLEWMNGMYLRQMSHNQLTDAILSYWDEYPPSRIYQPVNRVYMMDIVPLIQERLKTLKDAAVRSDFFFQEDISHTTDELIQKGMNTESVCMALERTLGTIGNNGPFHSKELKEQLEHVCIDLGLSKRQFFGLLRVAVTGGNVSPPLFETMEILGEKRCFDRIQRAVESLRI